MPLPNTQQLPERNFPRRMGAYDNQPLDMAVLCQ